MKTKFGLYKQACAFFANDSCVKYSGLTPAELPTFVSRMRIVAHGYWNDQLPSGFMVPMMEFFIREFGVGFYIDSRNESFSSNWPHRMKFWVRNLTNRKFQQRFETLPERRGFRLTFPELISNQENHYNEFPEMLALRRWSFEERLEHLLGDILVYKLQGSFSPAVDMPAEPGYIRKGRFDYVNFGKDVFEKDGKTWELVYERVVPGDPRNEAKLYLIYARAAVKEALVAHRINFTRDFNMCWDPKRKILLYSL